MIPAQLAARLFLGVAAGCLLLSCSRSPRSASTLAITHVAVIDATGAPPALDQTVVVESDRITALGPSASVAVPRDAAIVDARGKFLIPGLVDMHVHLTGAGEPDGSREFMLPLLLANGITTVRDMGSYLDALLALRTEIEKGQRLGPRIFLTGPYLDGDPPGYQPAIVVKSAAEARTAIDHLSGRGVDFIKVQSRLDRDSYLAIAEESRQRRIPFVGHVPDRVSALEASQAGQASIEHLTGVMLACSAKEEELRREQFLPGPAGSTPEQALERSRAWQRKLLDSYSPEKAGALFHAFAANGTSQTPTFPILVHFGFMTPAADLSNDSRLKYIPRKERDLWRAGVRERLEGRSAPDFALREEIVKRSLEIVREMQASGVRILAGTDTAAPNVLPGFSLHEDLAYLVQAGLTPMQALQTATKNPAEFLGRSSSQGTIERGKAADLLLLDANPLDDIHNTQKIHAVILRGRLLDRRALDVLLESEVEFATSH